jgi:hypothetical protein
VFVLFDPLFAMADRIHLRAHCGHGVDQNVFEATGSMPLAELLHELVRQCMLEEDVYPYVG